MLYNVSRSLVWLYFHTFYKIDITGIGNIPDDGAIICPNHFNIWDPMLVAICIPRKVRFMAKYEAFRNPIVKFYLKDVGTYPVKRGEFDLASIKHTLKLLKQKELVGLFPEGTRIKSGMLGEANSGVAVFAIKSEKVVIPVAITGNYKFFTKLKITFGQPIDFVKYKKDKMTNDDYYKLSQMVMENIDLLKKENI
jgi:1-acyl-sn-glycerol-3-phosphate acyltransferase